MEDLSNIETLQQASRILDIPAPTLNYYRLTGKISTKKSGGVYLVDVVTLKQELENAGYEPSKTRTKKPYTQKEEKHNG